MQTNMVLWETNRGRIGWSTLGEKKVKLKRDQQRSLPSKKVKFKLISENEQDREGEERKVISDSVNSMSTGMESKCSAYLGNCK